MSRSYENRLSIAAQSKLLLRKHLSEIFPLEKIETEYRFAEGRKWAFDVAIPSERLAFEIEGGIWVKGAHTRGKHFLSDCEKYNTATMGGWRVLRFSTEQVMEGKAKEWLEEAL